VCGVVRTWWWVRARVDERVTDARECKCVRDASAAHDYGGSFDLVTRSMSTSYIVYLVIDHVTIDRTYSASGKCC
jgi:hypothetical protein